MNYSRVVVALVFLLFQMLFFTDKSYGDVDCNRMMIACWESNPYEPGTAAYVIYNDACESADSSCIERSP